MLELRHVSKRYTAGLAVDDVSFAAPPGEITGYLGPNGSGKSTTMKMITGLIEMTSGRDPVRRPADSATIFGWKQRMGYVPEEPHLYAHLTGLEFLIMVGQLRDLPARQDSGTHRRPVATARPPRRPARRRSRPTRRACVRRCCSRRRCCTIRSCCCSTSRSRVSTSVRAGAAQSDPGTGRARQGRALQLS